MTIAAISRTTTTTTTTITTTGAAASIPTTTGTTTTATSTTSDSEAGTCNASSSCLGLFFCGLAVSAVAVGLPVAAIFSFVRGCDTIYSRATGLPLQRCEEHVRLAPLPVTI